MKGAGECSLAQAIVDSPLASRVMVNRVWGWLFGSGIVRTPSNFGLMGDRPGNWELLEYLAWRFRASGFSVKGLIRQIVLSETYLASSAGSEAGMAQDSGQPAVLADEPEAGGMLEAIRD